jgi:hypothetical protein
LIQSAPSWRQPATRRTVWPFLLYGLVVGIVATLMSFVFFPTLF